MTVHAARPGLIAALASIVSLIAALSIGPAVLHPVGAQEDGGAPTFAVAGQFAAGSIALLDEAGRPIGHLGSADDLFGAVNGCADTSLIVQDAGPAGLTILDVVDGRSGPIDLTEVLSAERTLADAHCDASGPDGAVVWLVTETFQGERASFEAWRVGFDPSSLEAMPVDWLGTLPVAIGGRVYATGPRALVITPTESGERLELADPGSEAEPTLLATVEQGTSSSASFTEPAIGPDGQVAIAERASSLDGAMESHVIMVDPTEGRITDRFEVDGASELNWLAHDRLGVVAFGLAADPGIDVYSIDGSVRSTGLVGSVEIWNGWAGALVDDVVWGLDGNEIVRAPLGGVAEPAHRFDETAFGPLLVVDPTVLPGTAESVASTEDPAQDQPDDGTPWPRLALLGVVALVAVGGVVAAVRQMSGTKASADADGDTLSPR